MEWFWQLIEGCYKSAAFTKLESVQPFDWIVVFLVLWGLAQGSRKGFSEMFGKLLGIFLISMAVLSSYKPLAIFLNSNLPVLSLPAAAIFSFFLLSIFFWFFISWTVNACGKLFKVEAYGIFKTLGGMILGGLQMLLLLSFVVQFLLTLPIKAIHETFQEGQTYSGHTIVHLVPDLQKLTVDPLLKSAHKDTKNIKNTAVPPKAGG